ncbi:MAG: hypothetical protein IPQ02_06585 [Saprospiraceae bacterium]|nr:hypothetical protein [Candidatus Defluviibacterium haderslevense]
MGEVETRLMWMFISNISGFFICLGLGFFLSKGRKKLRSDQDLSIPDRLENIKKELEHIERRLNYNDFEN